MATRRGPVVSLGGPASVVRSTLHQTIKDPSDRRGNGPATRGTSVVRAPSVLNVQKDEKDSKTKMGGALDTKAEAEAEGKSQTAAAEEPFEFDDEHLGMFEKAYVHRQFMQESDKKELMLLYVPFFALFLFCMLYGSVYGDGNPVITGILDDFVFQPFNTADDGAIYSPGGFDELGSSDDLWEWIHGPLISNIWGPPPTPEESGLGSEMYIGNGRNMPMGALKIRQVRRKASDCDSFFAEDHLNPAAKALWRAGCYKDMRVGDDGELDRNSIKRPFDVNRTESKLLAAAFDFREPDKLGSWSKCRFGGQIGNYPCGGHALILPFSLTRGEVRQLITALDESDWFSEEATRAVFAEWFMYNPDKFLVVQLQLVVEFAAGGGVVPTHLSTAFRVYNTAVYNGIYFVLTVVFGLFCLFYIFKFLRRGFRAVLTASLAETGIAARIWAGIEAFFVFVFVNGWNAVDALNLSLLIVVWYFRISWMVHGRRVEGDLAILDQSRYIDNFEQIADSVHRQGVYDSFNCLLACMRVLYYLKLNTSLSVLTRTISAGGTQLIGVGLIFVVVLIPFGMMGWVAYGPYIVGYSSIPRSLTSLLRMLLGDFDYITMKTIHRSFTPLYVSAFYVAMLFVLFNLVVAVLTMALATVHACHYDTDELEEILLREEESLPQDEDDEQKSIKAQISRSTAWRELRFWWQRVIAQFRARSSLSGVNAELERLRIQTPQGYWRTVWKNIVHSARARNGTTATQVNTPAQGLARFLYDEEDELENPHFIQRRPFNPEPMLRDHLGNRYDDVRAVFIQDVMDKTATKEKYLIMNLLEFMKDWTAEKAQLQAIQTGHDDKTVAALGDVNEDGDVKTWRSIENAVANQVAFAKDLDTHYEEVRDKVNLVRRSLQNWNLNLERKNDSDDDEEEEEEAATMQFDDYLK